MSLGSSSQSFCSTLVERAVALQSPLSAASTIGRAAERMGGMRGALSILAVAASLTGLVAQASAQTVLRVANWLPPKHPLIAEIITPWTEQVKEVTKGRVVMQVLPAPLGP